LWVTRPHDSCPILTQAQNFSVGLPNENNDHAQFVSVALGKGLEDLQFFFHPAVSTNEKQSRHLVVRG
jgi:hypothetical protein